MHQLESDARMGDGKHRHGTHDVAQLGRRPLQVLGTRWQRVEQLGDLDRRPGRGGDILDRLDAVVLDQHPRPVFRVGLAGRQPHAGDGGDGRQRLAAEAGCGRREQVVEITDF